MLMILTTAIAFVFFFSRLSGGAWSDQVRSVFSGDFPKQEERRTVTMFTTVLEADDDPQRFLAQENCLALLSKLDSAYVVVFTNSAVWKRIARRNGLFVFSSIESNQYGTPYLKAMFKFAFDHFNSEFYGYVNADILLDDTLIDSLRAISRDIKNGRVGDRLYIVGQRNNVQQELEDRFSPSQQSSSSFVVQMVLKGHRYWDSAVDYHIVTRNAFDWDSMPNFVIGRSGYDLYLVDTAYRDPQITMVDVTNTVHCAHMLSKDGNRSGIKRKTPDNVWNQELLRELPGGCCRFKSFGKLAAVQTVDVGESICLAEHGFEGYYDDSYYDTEKQFIRQATTNRPAESCLVVSENDVLGVLLPFCKRVTVVIMNVEACERTLSRLSKCGVEVQLGCNRERLSARQLVLSMFQRIDTRFDLVLVQSEKPLVMIRWIKAKLPVDGVLIMRRWLDPAERREIEKELSDSFQPIGVYPLCGEEVLPSQGTIQAPPEFDKTHDEHFGMAGFKRIK
ncbi:hypothetical protein BLSTO_02979 [Blastocystis sp. subtype 1]